jgi:hypothetical protein
MLQIKTICENDPAEFDRQVNNAIAEGWTLTKRGTITRESVYFLHSFYAELERVIITEAERCCENCKHRDTHPEDEPCFSCEDGPGGYPTKWEEVIV